MNRAIIATLATAIAASAAHAATLGTLPSAPSACVKLEAQSVRGTVMSVDDGAKTFVLATGEERVTVTFNESTKFLLDGKEADAERVLAIGSKVRVSHEGGLAQKVEASTKE